MRRRSVPFVLALAMALLCLGSASPARADALDQAKASGSVGEQVDGYVGLVSASAPAEVRALVTDLNERRRAHYEAIAKKNGTDPKAVARLAGAKLIQKAPSGHFVQNPEGQWVRKP